MNVGPGLPSRVSQPAHHAPLVPAYSVIVAGPARAGKSALVRLFRDAAPVAPPPPPTSSPSSGPDSPLAPAPAAAAAAHDFPQSELEVVWLGERILLRLIDSPALDFSAEDDLERTLRDILHFVESRYIDGARDEATVGESHVHLCLYILDPAALATPAGPALPPAEIAAIRRLSSRVNVLPVLGRAESVPLPALAATKRAVRRDLADAGLGFGIFDDPDATAPCAEPVDDLPLLPYALFAPDAFPIIPAPARDDLEDPARLARHKGCWVRRFRWGTLDALDVRHSDFLPLRCAVFLHRKALKKYTKDYLYEKFKVDSLLAAQTHAQRRVHPGSVHALLNHRDRDDVPPPPPSAPVLVPPVVVDDHPAASAGRKRKITMACNFCRSRKLKCDGIRPACAQCVKRGNSCDYQPHATSGAAAAAAAWKYRKTPAHAHVHPAEDVDELDGDGGSSASEAWEERERETERERERGGKRVSVDMLIAATLDHPPPPQPAPQPAPPPPPQQQPQPSPWYDAAGAAGMGVLDVGSEGDKKKRLNRQSANYGSKAVACVHCRARKTRCDAARPACGNCARRALACSYVHTQPSQPRSKGKKAAAAAAAAAKEREREAGVGVKEEAGEREREMSHSPNGGYAYPAPAPAAWVDSALEESAERDRPAQGSGSGSPPGVYRGGTGGSGSPPSAYRNESPGAYRNESPGAYRNGSPGAYRNESPGTYRSGGSPGAYRNGGSPGAATYRSGSPGGGMYPHSQHHRSRSPYPPHAHAHPRDPNHIHNHPNAHHANPNPNHIHTNNHNHNPNHHTITSNTNNNNSTSPGAPPIATLGVKVVTPERSPSTGTKRTRSGSVSPEREEGGGGGVKRGKWEGAGVAVAV